MELSAGEIVYSKAGRDKGKHFVVLEVLDQQFVLICDGKMRKVDKPKKKKVKHLNKTNAFADIVLDKLQAGVRVTNPDIRKSLAELNSDTDT